MTQINHIELGESSYDIIIDTDSLRNAGRAISTVYDGKKIVVITDENVYTLYGKLLITSLVSAGFEPQIITLAPGEETKSINNVGLVLSRLAQLKFTRKDLIVGFGGGVIGDLSGFVASCYMRGVDFVQIPTTLLAQVDSSVGGKTAVNLPEGKNLVGAFWQPKMVIIDPQLLKTLDDRQFASGMAEVIKYGAIFSDKLFDTIKKYPTRPEIMQIMPNIIYECCDLKRVVVEKDEKDTGERMLLNFGHTFGHAIEQLGNYTKYTHGEAVAIGMCVAARFGELMGITLSGEDKKIAQLCLGFGLPCDDDVDYQDFTQIVSIDKKAASKSISIVLINKIGESKIVPVTLTDFDKLIKQGAQQWAK